jgi:hypothetical protein
LLLHGLLHEALGMSMPWEVQYVARIRVATARFLEGVAMNLQP